MRGWTSPPTRRELLLLTLAITVFVVAYNADTTFAALGRSPLGLSPFASPRTPPIGPDGRKPAPYRDTLEDEIVGTFDWEPGRIAGVGAVEGARVIKGSEEDGDVYVKGEGRAGQQSLWLQGVGRGRYASDHARLGSTTVNEEFLRWGDHVPRTVVHYHSPGFTILDNVTLAFGTFFLVADDPSSMPDPASLGSSMVDHTAPPRDIDWQILPASNSVPKLGTYAGWMHGTTFLSYDDFADPHTLLSLTRLHAFLPASAPALPLSAPSRLLLPALKTFVDADAKPPIRSSLGIDQATLKAAYPALAGPLYHEDFDDFTGLSGPVLLERVILIDRGAASRARSSSNAWPLSPLFTHAQSSQNDTAWFESTRQTLLATLTTSHAPPKDEIVYLSGTPPPDTLTSELKRLHHPVRVLTPQTPWLERMQSISRAAILLGPSSPLLSEAAPFIPERAGLVEIFPDGAYEPAWGMVLSGMGRRYVAFQGARKIDPADPPSSRPVRPDDAAPTIDAYTIAQAVRALLAAR